MTHVFDTMRTRIAKHAAYIRTVREIRAMPLDVALDLDIHQDDAEKIAANAVYGPGDRRNQTAA